MDTSTTAHHGLDARPSDVRKTLPRALDLCSARWEPAEKSDLPPDAAWAGRLRLPVSAGLRHGELTGTLVATGKDGGCSLELHVEDSHYRVHRPALMLLLIAGLGAVILLLAPILMIFWPPFLNAVPLGIVLALGGWFLVVSRLRTFQAADFLKLLEDLTAGKDPDG